MKTIVLIIVSLWGLSIAAQEIKYVNADNGLLFRKQPDRKSERIGKLAYANQVHVLENTGLSLNVLDNGDTITGEWVYIRDVKTSNRGYVFSGYLTDLKLNKRVKINFDKFVFLMELENSKDSDSPFITDLEKDTVTVYLGHGLSPEGKKIKIQKSKYKNIELFQSYTNNAYISYDEGKTCELFGWKPFISKWKKLTFSTDQNSFSSEQYSKEEHLEFTTVTIQEFVNAVKNNCNPGTSNYIKDNTSVIGTNSGVFTRFISFKILLTDSNNFLTEKIIVFEFEVGC